MKILNNHKLLIDNECPMCRIYGGAFEKYKYVEKGTCLAYQNADEYLMTVVDKDRARNEIALLDTKTNEVIYGIDALTKILALRIPLIGKIMDLTFVKFFMSYVYKFISQNRKVIAPSKNPHSVCVPDVQLKYRLAYLVLVAVFSSIVLNKYMIGVYSLINLNSSFGREAVICFGQLFWQYLLLNKILGSQKWEYMGNLSTVSLIGTFMVIPGFLFPAQFKVMWFGLVVLIMTLEHLRRSKLLQIGIWSTASWLIYRFLVLGLLFI